MYVYNDRKLTKEQIDKLAAEKGVEVDVFLTNNPDIKIDEAVVETIEPEGKTSTTETDTTVDVTEVSDTESPSADGSLEYTDIESYEDFYRKGSKFTPYVGQESGAGAEIRQTAAGGFEPLALEEVVVTGEDKTKQKQAKDSQLAIEQLSKASKLPETVITAGAGLAATTADITKGFLELTDKYGVAPINYAIGRVLGYDTTLRKEVDASIENYSAIEDVTNLLREYTLKKYDAEGNEQDLYGLIEQGNYADAAELAANQGFSAAPYLALSIASPVYGSALIGASVTGQEIVDGLKNRPEATLSEIYGASLAKGGVEFATNAIGGGLLRGYSGIGKVLGKRNKLGKLINPSDYKKAIDIYTKTYLGKAADAGLGLTKAGAVNFIEEGSAVIGDALVDYGVYKDDQGLKSAVRNVINEGLVGAVSAAPIGTAGAFKSVASKKQALEFLAPKKWTQDLAKESRRLAEAQFNLDNAPKNKKEKFRKKAQKIESIIEMKKQQLYKSFEGLTKKELEQYAENLSSIDNALGEIGNRRYTKGQQEDAQKEIEIATKQNEALVGTELFDAKIEEGISKVLKNRELIAEAEEKAKGIKKKDLKIVYLEDADGEQDAIFEKTIDGKTTVYVNKRVAEQTGQTNVLGHELLHYITNNAFETDNASVAPLVESFKDYLKETQPEVHRRVQERIDANYTNEDGSIKEGALEEYFNVFSDLVAKEKIVVDESFSDKIKNSTKKFLNGLGFSGVKLDTGKDVFDFIRNYQDNISDFKFKQLDVNLESSKLKPKKDKQVSKESRSTVLEAINKLVPSTVKTKEEFQSPKVFNPIYESVIKEGGAINNYIKSRATSKQEAEKAIESVSDRLLNFDPKALRKEGKAVGAEAFGEFIFANTNFGKMVAKKALFKEGEKAGQEIPLDAPEATAQLADEVSIDETKVKSTTSKLRGKLGINQGDKIYNLAKKVSSEILGKDLPDNKLVAFINKKARESGLKKEIYKILGKEKAIDDTFINKYLNPKNTSQYILKDFSQRDLVKLEREVKDKIFFKQLPRLTKKAEILKAIEQGKLPKNQSLTSGAFIYEKLPTPTLEQAKEFFTQKRKAGLVNVITEMLVKDAAPEVTKDKMEPAKRAKVLSEIDREPTLKFSKSLLEQEKIAPGVKKEFLEALKTNDFKGKLESALKNKENSPWLKAANDYFTENPIKGLDQKLIKKINKEISSIFSISDKGEVAIKRFSDKEINEVLKIINTSLDKDLTLGYSFDSVDLIQGDKNISKADDFSLEGLNELRASFKVLTDYLINKGYTKQQLKSFLFGPFAKPANVGGFEIGNVKPDSFILEKNNLGKEKTTSKGTRISRGAIMTGVPDLMNNFLSNAKEGESIPLSFDTYSKNFWLNPKSVFNRMNQAKKFDFLKDLFQKGQKTKLELLDVIDAIEAIDVPMSAKRHFTTQLFADMAAIGKRASGTRYVLTDSKGDMFSFSDLEKMNLTRPEGDKGVFEHTKPANRVAVAAYAYVKSKDPKIKEILLQELETFDSALITESMDDSLRDLKLQSKMGLDYNSTDSPMVTRYRELISSLSDQGVFFYDIKTDKLITPLSVLSEGLIELNDSAQSIEEYKKEVLVKSSLIEPKIKASKSNNNNSAFKFSKAPTNKQTIETAATTDKALNIARDLNAPIKKIRVFDFDDTLAQTKSDVLYTMPDGTEGKLNAEQFASEGSTLLSEGAAFDFSEFNKVTEGKKGPLFKVAQTIAAKRGTEDVFVLTARAPESQLAIYEFLKSQGLDIPLKNITGLGDSTGDAKARWIVDKAADGYNDFYFADDAPQNVKAVRDALSVLDVKSKTQQAKIKFSKSLDLNKDFNDIIENKTGIASDKTYARVKAEVAGANKGRFNFFIPPSAEDFVGLLYSTLGKGDVGDAQMAWYKAHLLNPFARAMENLANDRAAMMQDFRGLKKALKIVPKNLRKKIKDSNFTQEQAVRAYIWDKQGMEIPGLSKKDQSDLVNYVNDSAELTTFADQLIAINKGDEYAAPDAGWVAGTIGTDFIKALNTTKRAKYLEVWQQNVDQIFSEANLNKLEAAYGANYREAMVDMLKRMRTGRNTSSGSDRLAARFTDWLTNSVGAIMFFNTRSAVLQTISAVNFINFSDNNILKAGQAFANQPQYWSDFKKLFNSPFLLDRRSGLKLNVNEADIAAMAKGPGNSARNVIAGLLKAGFLPTQLADSFAIASGGASFYRNRIKALKKEGLTEAEAEEIAFRDFREIAEESQQSSRPDKISQQQAGPLGRVVLAFANTPAQYARLIKKAASDLKNGRGDAKTNISKIIYYGVAQNLLFSALQQALFAIAFDDDEEEEKKDEKYFNIVNGMSDSILRGIGVGGAIVSVVKNTAIRLAKEADKKSPKYQDTVVKEVLQISPPISSKVGKLRSAGRSFSWNQEEMRTKGWSIDNPAYLASANVISAVTNVPLDRAVKKVTNIVDAGNEDIEYYKRVALALGWSAWELGIDKKGGKVAPPKTDMDKLYDLNKKQQIDSLTSLGISKKQIKLLKLEEDRVNAILNPKSIKQIKVSKRDSLFGLNKKEQVKALEKLGFTKKEIKALRLENDRVEAIINKQKQEN